MLVMTQILSVFTWTSLAWLGCLAAVSFVTADLILVTANFILGLARLRRYRRMAKRVRGE